MRTDSRHHGFLYWVKWALMGVLGAYFSLSSDACPAVSPVSFPSTFLVLTMQALGLAYRPAAVDAEGAPGVSPDPPACAGSLDARPPGRPCPSFLSLPSHTTAFITCPSGAFGLTTHTSYDAGGHDSVPPCVLSDIYAAAATRTASLLFVIVLVLSLICTALLHATAAETNGAYRTMILHNCLSGFAARLAGPVMPQALRHGDSAGAEWFFLAQGGARQVQS